MTAQTNTHVDFASLLEDLISQTHVASSDVGSVMRQALSGNVSEARIAAILVALRMRHDSDHFLSVIVDAVRGAAVEVEVPEHLQGRIVDTCGTGGDRSGSINVSTTAAFVLAAAGVPIAKHGNRAASSSSGSADVLKALGVKIDLTGYDVVRCIEQTGMGFFFAPNFHPGLRHVGGVRKDLAVRTVFNWIGPLVNPAGAKRQVIGTGSHQAMAPIFESMKTAGATDLMVVRGTDGLDELSTSAPSNIMTLRDGVVEETILDPLRLGIDRSDPHDLRGGDPQHNAERLRAILGGESGPQSDVVALNAAAGLIVAGVQDDWEPALAQARELLRNGSALRVLDEFIAFTNDCEDL